MTRCMKSAVRPARGQAGFTLVELMISLTVVSVAIAAAFTMAFSLMSGFRDSRSAVQTESTARTVLDLIASGVRAGSPGLKSGTVFDTCSNADIATLEVINSAVASDELRVLHASGGALAFLTSDQPTIVSSGSITVDDNSDFEKGIWMPALVIDPFNDKGHFIEVRASGADVTLMETRINPGPACAGGAAGAEDFGAGSMVVRAIHMHYRVDPPYLLVDPDANGPEIEVEVAEGIEDFQVAVGVEDGNNLNSLTEIGLISGDDEWHYNVATPGVEAGPGPADGGDWRALRLTIVGYAARDANSSTSNLRPAAEDRGVGTVGDGIRRRAFSTTVEMRNFAAN